MSRCKLLVLCDKPLLLGEIARLRAALDELTTEITHSSVLMDNISLAKFERALDVLKDTTP